MRLTIKIGTILVLVYVAIVVIFESTLGYYQPQSEGTLMITTTTEDGSRTRVLSRIILDDTLFLAANHWPRAWYGETLENPEVTIDMDGVTAAYRATPVTPDQDSRLRQERALPFLIKFLTGFPPRRFLRLEPVSQT